MGLSKPEVKKMGCVWSFLLLEEFKNFLVWKYFLAYLGSSAKTTIILTIKSVSQPTNRRFQAESACDIMCIFRRSTFKKSSLEHEVLHP